MILRVRLVPLNMLIPFSKYFNDRSKALLFLWTLFVMCFRFVLSVTCNFVITCREKADL